MSAIQQKYFRKKGSEEAFLAELNLGRWSELGGKIRTRSE